MKIIGVDLATRTFKILGAGNVPMSELPGAIVGSNIEEINGKWQIVGEAKDCKV